MANNRYRRLIDLQSISTCTTMLSVLNPRRRRIVRKASSYLEESEREDSPSPTESSSYYDAYIDSNNEPGSWSETNEGETAGCQVSMEKVKEEEATGREEDEKLNAMKGQQRLLPKQVPKFIRRELQLSSNLIGKGAFSEVYEVEGIKIIKNLGNSCTKDEQESRLEMSAALNKQRGQDTSDNQKKPSLKLAVKHLSRKLLRRPKHFYQAALDLSREVHYMTRLNHPHILKVRAETLGGTSAFSETGRFDGFFIVTDFLSDTLEQRIQKWRRFIVYQTMETLPKMIMKTQYANQLASALGYLHDRRIIFRDLKPDNIGFLHHSPHTLQLFDFGICRTLPRSTRSSMHSTGSEASVDNIAQLPEEEETFLMSLAGTTRYMASEVMANGRYNLKADCHSFGMVIYEMYSEKKPFLTLRHDSFYEFVCRWKIRPAVNHLNLPKGLENLITGSWCPSLEERLSMRDVNEILPDILREMELEAQMMHKVVAC